MEAGWLDPENSTLPMGTNNAETYTMDNLLSFF
jgi:hypothetical protein